LNELGKKVMPCDDDIHRFVITSFSITFI